MLRLKTIRILEKNIGNKIPETSVAIFFSEMTKVLKYVYVKIEVKNF